MQKQESWHSIKCKKFIFKFYLDSYSPKYLFFFLDQIENSEEDSAHVQDLKVGIAKTKIKETFLLDPRKKHTCGSSIAHIIRVLPPAHI